MQSGSAARTATNTATGSLSYIDTLISGATAQGKYSIIVEGDLLNDSMITTLRNVYGYTVDQQFNSMGSYPRYTISW
jgi:hypothetical protein